MAGAVVLIAGTGFAFYRYPELSTFLIGDAPAQLSPDPATTASTQPETPFQEHIAQAGIRSCAQLFPVLGKALTLGSSYAVNTQWNDSSPNSHPVQAVAGMTYDMADYKGQAAGVVFASPVGDNCEGNLVRVAPFPKPCEEMASTLPEGSSLAETLAGTPLYNLANNAGQALLIPTGASCVVVSVARMAG
ncbi:hypothetical protein [Ciceribacter sp. RN22]|uniref:hypothetical protein n=1 Tax=Ciceribacter sp. RN22 TaxID=2954932 RepID=UPI002093195A|nr:hypothetical protein [Ciceribacter sp. RN22]MCO6181010.1 hypothetical protein [Ciceribacter sp. RN22]